MVLLKKFLPNASVISQIGLLALMPVFTVTTNGKLELVAPEPRLMPTWNAMRRMLAGAGWADTEVAARGAVVSASGVRSVPAGKVCPALTARFSGTGTMV